MNHNSVRYPHDIQILGPTAQRPTIGTTAAELFEAATRAAEAEGRRVERKASQKVITAMACIITVSVIGNLVQWVLR